MEIKTDVKESSLILLKQGAEARVFESNFVGRRSVIKERFSKKYRHPTLDSKITLKCLNAEARCMTKARRLGVSTPVLYSVDPVLHTLTFEYVEGPSVKDILLEFGSHGIIEERLDDIALQIGDAIGKLHDGGLIHGDLTTSNMLLKSGTNQLVLIDFGLSFTSTLPEDKAVDLYVLERALLSMHSSCGNVVSDVVFLLLLLVILVLLDCKEKMRKRIEIRDSYECLALGWETLYKIAIGIARGLEYLHRGCNTRILHSDIKPHNILLDEDFCPKISDFGLAKICPREKSIISMVGARGTTGYIAPEVFCRNFGEVSHKSDVYSYGMMVLEMVGGRKNIDASVDFTSEIYFPHWIYKRLELNEELGLLGLLNEGDEDNARKMIILSLWCIQTDPSNRPSMSRVVEMLEGSSDSLQIPSKPYLSSPPRSPLGSSTIMVSLQ